MPSTLVSVAPGYAGVYRVARRSGEVFSPPSWQYAREDGTFGGRFDDPGLGESLDTTHRFRMIYCASDTIGAYGETLAQFRVSLTTLAGIDRETRDDESLTESLRGVTDPGDATRRVLRASEWCQARQLGHTHLGRSLEFVDITAAQSLSHLRDQSSIARIAVQLGLDDIDIHAITGPYRALTQACARYIYEQADTTGNPQYAGIRYLSHYGASQEWECWAIFSDRFEHFGDFTSITIRPNDPGLLEAARIHHISIEISNGIYLRP